MVTTDTKKRKAPEDGSSSKGAGSKLPRAFGNSNSNSPSISDNIALDGYTPFSLKDIKVRIASLSERVPKLPKQGLDPDDTDEIKNWATQLQAVVEEFNLLVCCISAATYKWQSERSGAADQNLSVLSAELANSQDQISSTVTPRLTNVLAPVVDLIVDKVVITREPKPASAGNHEKSFVEVKQNHYCRKQVDPSFLKLCSVILSRNAPMIRQVVLANFHKIDKCMTDYLTAQIKDSQHDSRGFAY